jgi:hypothetical protein
MIRRQNVAKIAALLLGMMFPATAYCGYSWINVDPDNGATGVDADPIVFNAKVD